MSSKANLVEQNIPNDEQYKINLHILESCNYKCKHCFAHFDNKKVLTINEWKHIIDNCTNGIFVKEFNIAGGEPFLYKDLDELIEYIYSIGISVSIITNGSLMTEEWIKRNAKYLKTIGFSIDSFNNETCIIQGRCNTKKEILTKEKFIELCNLIKQYNPECNIKVNTVVTSINKSENISKIFIEENIPVSRWKIFKMDIFKNENFNNSDIQVTDKEYEDFIILNLNEMNYKKLNGFSNNISGIYKTDIGMTIIAEQNVNASYIMIDANGNLVDDSLNDSYVPIINCVSEDFTEGFKKVSFNKDLYFSRYCIDEH